MKTLYNELEDYADSDYYGFHMPGHKRNRNVTGIALPYGIDITEIEGFDDLHHAKGILKQAQESAARVFHAEESCFLVNGSTAGILSAILGCTQRGDRILMARNCHKSVYHAVEMNELEPVYLYPAFYTQRASRNTCPCGAGGPCPIRYTQRASRNTCPCGAGGLCPIEYEEQEINGMVAPEEVRDILVQDAADANTARIRAVVITSPTYDGIVSDIEQIAQMVHAYQIPLIVDEAHGAHFGFHPYFPENANTKGADVVIHSIHKTLPSLTQTALIHMNGVYADRERIKKYLRMIQTSSPSYMLMAGMDACISLLASDEKDRLFENYVRLLRRTREQLSNMKHLHLMDLESSDHSKILISVKGTKYSGRQLYFRLLNEYHLQMEMAAGSYVLAMTSVADTEEGFARLVQAFMQIDRELVEECRITCHMQQPGKKKTSECKTQGGSKEQSEYEKQGESKEQGKYEEQSEYVEQSDRGRQLELQKQINYKKQVEFGLPKLERVYSSAEVEKIAHEEYIAQIDKKYEDHLRDSKGIGSDAKKIKLGTDTDRIALLPWKRCVGLISMEYAYLYPPGIPLIVPGEKISEEVVRLIEEYKKMGFQIEGIKQDGYIEVMRAYTSVQTVIL